LLLPAASVFLLELDCEVMASARCLARVDERAALSGSESWERSICSIDFRVENVGGAWAGLVVDVRWRLKDGPLVDAVLVAVFAELLDVRRWIRVGVGSRGALLRVVF
jgi:hypothetical protein